MRHVVERQQEAQRAHDRVEAEKRAVDNAEARAHEQSRAESLQVISALLRAMDEAGNPGTVKIKREGDRTPFERPWRAWFLGTHSVWHSHEDGGSWSPGEPARTVEVDIALTTDGAWLRRSPYNRGQRKNFAARADELLQGLDGNHTKADPLDVIALASHSRLRLRSGYRYSR